MRIAFSLVKSIGRGGGIEKYTAQLGSHLVLRGHEVTVYTMANYEDATHRCHGMEIVPCSTVSSKYGEKLIAGAVAAAKIFTRGDYDIVHQHSIAAGAFNWLASQPRRHMGLLQMHGIEWHRTKWGRFSRCIVHRLERIALAQFHYWTAVSRTQCRALKTQYGIQAVYIPTAADVMAPEPCDLIHREYGLDSRGYILFASRLVSEKGAHLLVEAFKSLRTERRLVIAGDAPNEPGYTAALKTQAKSDPRILFVGMVEGQKLRELFSNCYVYVQPSIVEGLSLSLLEAMSYGNCCVVSNIEENREAIDSCGVTFESQNPESLRKILLHLIESPQTVGEMGQAARERVRHNYSWDLVTDEMEQLYASMLRDRGR